MHIQDEALCSTCMLMEFVLNSQMKPSVICLRAVLYADPYILFLFRGPKRDFHLVNIFSFFLSGLHHFALIRIEAHAPCTY
jgi:hypothetical protein